MKRHRLRRRYGHAGPRSYLRMHNANANWGRAAQAILVSDDFEGRVSALADEAARAGDHDQVAMCEAALGISATDEQRRVARDECARVLADADAAS